MTVDAEIWEPDRVFAKGDAIFELAPDGRIERVIPDWDPLPPLPQSWSRSLATAD